MKIDPDGLGLGLAIALPLLAMCGAMAASDIWGNRKPEDCRKACEPSAVLECGDTIRCAPAPSASSPCPGGDCKGGPR